MDPVNVFLDSDIAVVTLSNPPVNAINQQVRKSLMDVVKTLEIDEKVKGVVLEGEGANFVAGADINELGEAPKSPFLPDVLDAIEMSSKPWVASINGNALGGGLEIAMACHARVAASGAKLGMPEVQIGVIPGAGGTVRLPRLVSMSNAIRMITGGKPVSSQYAAELGLVDLVTPDDPKTEAIKLAKEISESGNHVPTVSRTLIGCAEVDWDAEQQKLIKRTRGAIAPLEALGCLKENENASVGDAMRKARDTFLALAQGQQASALRHIFFAEKAAGKSLRDLDALPSDLSCVGVIGGGTMGASIATALLLSGLTVILIERTREASEAAMSRVRDNLNASAQRGIISEQTATSTFARLTVSDDYCDLVGCSLIIEAVFENIDVKREVFATLDEVVDRNAILATNTSYLDVNDLATSSRYPDRVLGLHFFAPAHVMKLLEIIRGRYTSEVALATGAALARKLRKISVVSGVCDGFIGNRVMSAYRRECEFMLEEGATPAQIDAAMRNFGFPMGIYEVQDMSGLDIAWAQRKARRYAMDGSVRYSRISDQLCEAGRLGKKAGRGWYNYEQGQAGVDDPEVVKLICEESKAAGYFRREFSEHEIMERIVTTMQSEGMQILEEGIAENADDIDVVMVNGFGFPRHRGGPMYMCKS